ncbi:MAG: IS3 family transposase, partial [Kiritimatiellae bacterium]|nr:IS3 family transposase [Kiritimatiellia bacterium]
RELGLRKNQIYKWRKELENKGGVAFSGKGHPADPDPEKTQQRKELATAKEEIEILKKAAAYFARELK